MGNTFPSTNCDPIDFLHQHLPYKMFSSRLLAENTFVVNYFFSPLKQIRFLQIFPPLREIIKGKLQWQRFCMHTTFERHWSSSQVFTKPTRWGSLQKMQTLQEHWQPNLSCPLSEAPRNWSSLHDSTRQLLIQMLAYTDLNKHTFHLENDAVKHWRSSLHFHVNSPKRLLLHLMHVSGGEGSSSSMERAN